MCVVARASGPPSNAATAWPPVPPFVRTIGRYSRRLWGLWSRFGTEGQCTHETDDGPAHPAMRRLEFPLHVTQFAAGLDEDLGPSLDLLVPGVVPVALEALDDHVPLGQELPGLVRLLDLPQHVRLPLDDEHAIGAVGREVRLGLLALAVGGLLAPERQELHEHLERLGLPPSNRNVPRADERNVSRHRPTSFRTWTRGRLPAGRDSGKWMRWPSGKPTR